MSLIKLYDRIPFDDTALHVRVLHDMTLTKENKFLENYASWHEQIEILYFHRGGAVVHCENRVYTVNDNEVVIINPYEMHQISYHSGQPLYDCLMIDASLYQQECLTAEVERYINLLTDTHVCFNNYITHDEEFLACIKAICQEMKNKELMYKLAVKSHVYHMLIYLFRRHVYKGSSFCQLVENAERHDRIKPALDLMKSKMAEHITLEELAEVCHVSASHFCRLFHQITGYSPIRYLLDIRLQEGVTLLKQTDKSVTQIAYDVGFDDVGYFSRKFKDQFGLSPMQLKKRCLAEQTPN